MHTGPKRGARAGCGALRRRGFGGGGRSRVAQIGVVAAGEKDELGFFSPALQERGSWQPDSCHDPKRRNAGAAAIATGPRSATAREWAVLLAPLA